MKCAFFAWLCLALQAQSPFRIDFPEKKELSQEDYLFVQQELRKINLRPLLHELYPEGKDYAEFNDFLGRSTRGARQILIDPEKKRYPVKGLQKIGNGSTKNCVVCAVPFSGGYPEYIPSIAQGLAKQGFNGHFLYYIGGFPNPTGKEIQYAAVPYSFKIFAMVEAFQLGFQNVLWIDSSAYPVRDINPLFDEIESTGALLCNTPLSDSHWKYILPSTRRELKALTQVDVLDPGTQYIVMVLFGLNAKSAKTEQLIQQYYQLVERGTPFLSCFPEEWVLTALLGQPPFASWRRLRKLGRVKLAPIDADHSIEQMEKAAGEGAYFYHRRGR